MISEAEQKYYQVKMIYLIRKIQNKHYRTTWLSWHVK